MHRSWPLLEPILERLRPASIVYLGPGDSPALNALADRIRAGETTLRAVDDSRSPMESLPEVAGEADVVLVDSQRMLGQLDAVFALLDALSPPLPGGFPTCFVAGAVRGAPRAALDNFLRITSRDVELATLAGDEPLLVVCERPLGSALRQAHERGAAAPDGDPRVLELEGRLIVLEAVALQRERYAEVLESAFADQAEQLHATWSSPYWRLTKPLQRAVALARRARAKLRGKGPEVVGIPLSSLDWAVEEAVDRFGQPARWTKVSEASGRDDWRLEQEAPSRIAYRIDAPPGCRLSLPVGIRAGRWSAGKEPARVEAALLAADGRQLAGDCALIDPGELHSAGPAAVLHLDFGEGGDGCRLVLAAHPVRDPSARPTVAWEEADVAVPAGRDGAPSAPSARAPRVPPPTISVVMPVHDPAPRFLERAIRSVLAQTYERWQLCIADDGSRDPEVVEMLREHAARDDRIALVRREHGGGIASGTNAAMELARGEFVALLDHDDELEHDALEEVAACLREHPDTDVVYTDEDRLLPDGTRFGAMLKPGWSPELLRSGMYTCHLGVYRRTLMEEVGGFRSEFDGAQDFDLMLRIAERTQRIRHVPRVLYHWRASDASVAINPAAKPYAYDAGTRALQSHLDRAGVPGTAERTELPGLYRVVHRSRPDTPVSVIVRVDGQDDLPALQASIEGISARTRHRALEILVAGERSPSTVLGVQAHASVDDAARAANGRHLLVLDEPCVPRDGGWLDVLLGHVELAGVGAVGAKVLRPDRTIEHAGVMVGEGLPLPVYRAVPSDFVGYLGNLVVSCNYCAVAGVMMTARELFLELGGLGPARSPVAEADYCLRARSRDLRTVFAPDATFELTGAARGRAASLRELAEFKQRWLAELPRDPYFPNFWQRRGALPSPPPAAPLVAAAQTEDREQERREEDLDPHDDQRGGPHREALL